MHSFLRALEIQRWDDHRYYHHSRINQSLHLLSAISFLAAYVTIFKNPAASALLRSCGTCCPEALSGRRRARGD
jgi:hypothetical protein